MRQSPCKGCLKRSVHPNCHIGCEPYIEFVTYRQTYRERRRKDMLICDYIKDKQRKKRR